MSRTLNLAESEALDSSIGKKQDVLRRSLRLLKVLLYSIDINNNNIIIYLLIVMDLKKHT